jgi:hypothetical protein
MADNDDWDQETEEDEINVAKQKRNFVEVFFVCVLITHVSSLLPDRSSLQFSLLWLMLLSII